MNYFGCSRYMIDQARKMKSESGPGVVAPDDHDNSRKITTSERRQKCFQVIFKKRIGVPQRKLPFTYL